ncbi:alpha/beta hydrolase [Thiorhodococcus mannitoliphagus]|uniref:Alpha/beta hydrolase n=1 Tax=Thiorhodococcus mannitoliphagus TaxID=329406 RepID=A0A6P1DYY9_9GAMM|nr:alpha/beta hydrolase [Thiorhodococcus mannitoliphagus]
MPLPEAVPAQREEFVSAGGVRLAYYADRLAQGRPLLLIHSINAAASSYEVRPLFDAYGGRRPVYSLDLPGFGHSDRSPRDYTPELYGHAIAELLRSVIGEPADVLALSLGCEFAVRAALLAPDHVASLVLVSPTGFGAKPVPPPSKLGVFARLLSLPSLSQGLYDLVASRRSITYFLGLCCVGDPPEAMIDYAYATSHQPGARYAPLTFLSMRLFTPDAIAQLYERLADLPVLVIADQDPFVGFERLEPFLMTHPSWSRVRLAPHRGLPHWEQIENTLLTLDQFWA